MQAALERKRSARKSLTDQIGRCKIAAPSGGRVEYTAPSAPGRLCTTGSCSFGLFRQERRLRGRNEGPFAYRRHPRANNIDQYRVLRSLRLGDGIVRRRAPAASAGRWRWINQLLRPYFPPSLDFDKEIAGLSKGSRPEILTWGTNLALAIVRARSVRGAFAPMLNPIALNQEAARHGVADFARFREEFLTGRVPAGGAFRDPRRKFSASSAGCTRSITHAALSHFTITFTECSRSGPSLSRLA